MKSLYLPVEIYKREFIEKLFLGLIAVNRGYRVIIGEANNAIFKKAGSGILLHKDHANWSENLLKSAKKRGMQICALDEEGLIIGDTDLYKSSRVSDWALGNLDALFCWGDYQKKIISEVGAVNNIYVVGSPKIDIAKLHKENYSHKANAEKIKHILINTRFTYNNGVYGDYEIDNLIHLGVIKSYSDIANYNKMYANDERIFAEFCKLINLLSKNPDIVVTIRPHPLEWQQTYVNLVADKKNVFVDSSKDLRHQISESDFIIHDGCTTAIEASAMGKVVLGLRPAGLNPAYDDFANKFSINFNTAEDVNEFIANSFDCSMDAKYINDAQHYINNWGDNKYSCDKIMDVIDLISEGANSNIKYHAPYILNYKMLIYKILSKHALAQNLVSFIAPKAYRKFMNNTRITSRKFPGIAWTELQDILKWFGSTNCTLLDVNKIKITLRGDQVLILEPMPANEAKNLRR